MLTVLMTLCLEVLSEALPHNNLTCSTLFRDQQNLQPLGCDENTMWTNLGGSKLACASSCLSNEACVVFTYASETAACSLCGGDFIQNITFNSEKVFTWPLQTVKTNLPVASYMFFPVPNGIFSGFV
ncbi:hypothetical protein BgiBS90_026920, partial [Biomphalaria glabrata]